MRSVELAKIFIKVNDVFINMVKTLPSYLKHWEVKARSSHKCSLCDRTINPGEIYFKYINPKTGWEMKACNLHFDPKEEQEYEQKQQMWWEKAKKSYIFLETDSSGSVGERWAFVAFLVSEGEMKEIYRERGETPPEYRGSPTLGEGFAVLKALKWLIKTEQDGELEKMPVKIYNDNYAVVRKLETLSTKGHQIWRELMTLLEPLVAEGRFKHGGPVTGQADSYAQKW